MGLAGFRLLGIGGPKWIQDFSVYEPSGQVAAQENAALRSLRSHKERHITSKIVMKITVPLIDPGGLRVLALGG